MSEYWKSTAKHYCKICQIWLSGHPRNVATHEQSASHAAKKERVLKQMEINQRQQAQQEEQKNIEIAAINAAAHASMKRDLLNDPTASIDYAANRFNRFSMQQFLPQRSIAEEVSRPIEEERIAQYIAARTGQKVEFQSTVAAEDDFRKTLVYYDDEQRAPSHMRDNPIFQDKQQWKEIKDKTTDFPLWIHNTLNIALWERPKVLGGPLDAQLPSNQEDDQQPTDGDENEDEDEDHVQSFVTTESKRARSVSEEVADMAKKVPKVSYEAPVPGEWKVVPESESVFMKGTAKDSDDDSHGSSDGENETHRRHAGVGILDGYESDEDLKAHPALQLIAANRRKRP